MAWSTSPEGIAFIERHEGVVLNAYRDPVGVWTIGPGLTAASGVVKPRAGMRITPLEATELLRRALPKYERRAVSAMAPRSQNAFDGGVSFDFNTGAIHRASWVNAYISGNWQDLRERIVLWNRGGGRVLPGLTRRRREEADLIVFGDYRDGHVPPGPVLDGAKVVVPASLDEREAARVALRRLGYAVGDVHGVMEEPGVRAFQADHGLLVDGVVGRATLSTLQRRIDAPKAIAKPIGVGAAGGGGAAVLDAAEPAASLPNVWLAVLAGLVLVWLGLRLWIRRDFIAAKLHRRAPRVAAFLRRF